MQQRAERIRSALYFGLWNKARTQEESHIIQKELRDAFQQHSSAVDP